MNPNNCNSEAFFLDRELQTWLDLRAITQIPFELPNKNTNQTESNTLSLAKLEISTGNTRYIAQQLPNNKSLLTNPKSGWTTDSYSWSEVLKNTEKGWWKLHATLVAATEKPKESNSNVMDTPEKVEVGDTIVYYTTRGGENGVEVRAKDIVRSIRQARTVGTGRFVSVSGSSIDLSVVKTTGLYVVKKAEKPKLSAANAPVGSLMHYSVPSEAEYTNVKINDSSWGEVMKGEIVSANLTNGFIDRMIKDYDGSIFHTPKV